MPVAELAEYQTTIARNLRATYHDVPVETEWRSQFDNNTYSPRVDIAVGPFAIEHGVSFTDDYDNLMRASRHFIECLIGHHLRNIGNQTGLGPGPAVYNNLFNHLVTKNLNARCFMAIEIENRVSRKHLMGSAINASALGRIGIAVGWTDEKLRAFVRLHRYFSYLYDVKQNIFDTSNLLIVSKNQFRQASET